MIFIFLKVQIKYCAAHAFVGSHHILLSTLIHIKHVDKKEFCDKIKMLQGKLILNALFVKSFITFLTTMNRMSLFLIPKHSQKTFKDYSEEFLLFKNRIRNQRENINKTFALKSYDIFLLTEHKYKMSQRLYKFIGPNFNWDQVGLMQEANFIIRVVVAWGGFISYWNSQIVNKGRIEYLYKIYLVFAF